MSKKRLLMFLLPDQKIVPTGGVAQAELKARIPSPIREPAHRRQQSQKESDRLKSLERPRKCLTCEEQQPLAVENKSKQMDDECVDAAGEAWCSDAWCLD